MLVLALLTRSRTIKYRATRLRQTPRRTRWCKRTCTARSTSARRSRVRSGLAAQTRLTDGRATVLSLDRIQGDPLRRQDEPHGLARTGGLRLWYVPRPGRTRLTQCCRRDLPQRHLCHASGRGAARDAPDNRRIGGGYDAAARIRRRVRSCGSPGALAYVLPALAPR